MNFGKKTLSGKFGIISLVNFLKTMDTTISEDVQEIANDIKDIALKLEGKTLLVTGGSGFIGGYFLDVISFLNEHQFLKPCKVICLDNLIVGDQKRFAHLLKKTNTNF